MLERVILFLDGTRETEETESFFQILCQEKIRYSYWNAGGSQFEKESEWQQIKEMIVKEMDSKAGTILISDNRDVCQSALSEKYPVIVYLNGPNEDNGNSFQGVRYAIESLKGIDGRYLERVCRRYAGLPWEILQTGRCIVRETTVEDVDAFYKIYEEPSITEYMEGLFEDREEEIQYTKDYRKSVYEFYEYGLWTVVEKNDMCVIGRAGISWREETETVELGFVIAKPYQRKGYAFEVCSAVLAYAYEELDIRKVSAYVDKRNQISKALCKKLGFRFQGEIVLKNGFGKEEKVESWIREIAGQI